MQAKASDRQFQDSILSKVEDFGDSWAITHSEGRTLCIPRYAAVPKIGDTARFYGRGIGYPVRGVDIAGVEVYYSTEAEYAAKLQLEQDAAKMKRQAEYAAHRDNNTARINALPGPLQKRLFQFRERNPEFGSEFEGYELATAEMAAAVFHAAERRGEESAEDWFKRFREAPWVNQEAIFGPACEGASGNMAEFAIRQAWLLTTAPDYVPKDHGALCILVGCERFKACDAYVAMLTPPPESTREE